MCRYISSLLINSDDAGPLFVHVRIRRSSVTHNHCMFNGRTEVIDGFF